MAPIRARYDVCVIGGGPVGSATAIAFARRGARVLMLEADPRASRRFAGEWIHPAGVAVLDALRAGRLEPASPRVGYGFALFPEDGSPPIELPYSKGVALSAPHEAIVSAIRSVALDTPGVEFIPFAHVVSMEGHRVVAVTRPHGAQIEASADRIVGADGRSSVARRQLGFSDNSAALSYMASVDLCGLELPREGFGHVILGGPGPALLYRIGDDLVRGCFDVPVHYGAASRSPAFLWESFRRVLPESMLEPFRRGLKGPRLRWAATRFRPRSDFGRGHVALVGDAVGHVHPMTAIGLSMGLMDAEAVAAHERLEPYARRRRGYVPELLANVLYSCFRRDDAGARSMRAAMFRALRSSAEERRRTIQILSSEDERVGSFGGVCLRIAAGAIGTRLAQAAREGGLAAAPAALEAFGEWLQWPAAALVPPSLRETYRRRSTVTHPIPMLASWVPVKDAPRAPSPVMAGDARRSASSTADETPPPVASAMVKATEFLIVELEALATQIGTTPDEVLAIPGLRMMRAITATEMRSGVAARMTIGRRWLARQGVRRLIEAGRARGALRTSELAGLLIVLLGGADWGNGQIVDLEEGIHLLLRLQTDKGGFAPGGSHLETQGATDVRTTALSCRALVAARRRMSGARGEPPSGVSLDVDSLDVAVTRAFHWLRQMGSPDASLSGSSEDERIVRTACSVEALAMAAEGVEGDRALYKSSRWIASRLTSIDFASQEGRDDASRLYSIAVALRAVLASTLRASPDGRSHALPAGLEPLFPTIDAAVRLLARSVLDDEAIARADGAALSPPRWEVWSEILETLAHYEAVRKLRRATSLEGGPSYVAGRGARSFAESGPSEVHESAGRASTRDHAPDSDWDDCRRRLVEVSRSFSQPIALLPRHLEVAVTLAYLLCRVADSIEDHAAVPQASRAPLMAKLIDVLEAQEDPEAFARAFEGVLPAGSREGDPELLLTCNLHVVMRVLRREPARTQATLVRWIVEMARGMVLYTYRRPGADGIVALDTVPDLERYCYFVAGTVGHLLTDLFLEELGDEATPELALSLRTHAEPFGMGLQLVNILKDVTDDQSRRWSFIPRTACASRALRVDELTDPDRRTSAHAAVAPLFDIARDKLDDGMKYALAIPPAHAGIRRFCLLPLWMAARTLVLARGGDAMFTPGAAVKIPRDEVAALSIACVSFSGDDDELRARYAALWSETGSLGVRPEGRSAG